MSRVGRPFHREFPECQAIAQNSKVFVIVPGDGQFLRAKRPSVCLSLWLCTYILPQVVECRRPVAHGLVKMSATIKFLPVIALAVALSPFAAQARTAPQPANGGYHIVVQTGVNANSFPNSFGG
jgi:hypothetical protein